MQIYLCLHIQSYIYMRSVQSHRLNRCIKSKCWNIKSSVCVWLKTTWFWTPDPLKIALPGRDFINALYWGSLCHPQNSSQERRICILYKVSKCTNIHPNIFQSTENTAGVSGRSSWRNAVNSIKAFTSLKIPVYLHNIIETIVLKMPFRLYTTFPLLFHEYHSQWIVHTWEWESETEQKKTKIN